MHKPPPPHTINLAFTHHHSQYELCKGAACVELACQALGVQVDSSQVARYSAVSEKVYRAGKAVLQKALGVAGGGRSARELCVQVRSRAGHVWFQGASVAHKGRVQCCSTSPTRGFSPLPAHSTPSTCLALSAHKFPPPTPTPTPTPPHPAPVWLRAARAGGEGGPRSVQRALCTQPAAGGAGTGGLWADRLPGRCFLPGGSQAPGGGEAWEAAGLGCRSRVWWWEG